MARGGWTTSVHPATNRKEDFTGRRGSRLDRSTSNEFIKDSLCKYLARSKNEMPPFTNFTLQKSKREGHSSRKTRGSPSKKRRQGIRRTIRLPDPDAARNRSTNRQGGSDVPRVWDGPTVRYRENSTGALRRKSENSRARDRRRIQNSRDSRKNHRGSATSLTLSVTRGLI